MGLRFLAGYGTIGSSGVEDFVPSLAQTPKMFQARYAEVILHIRNYAEKLPHSNCYKRIKMNELQKYIIEALKSLIEFDIELVKNQPREECINHRFAQHLEEILRKKGLLTELRIDVDVEYDKYKEDEKKSSDGKNIRPDIIAHKRRSGDKNNLIVIEAKKKYIDKKDKRKIIDLVNNKKFKYSLGAGVAYLPDRNYMKIQFLLSNNTWEIYQLNKNDFTIKKTKR